MITSEGVNGDQQTHWKLHVPDEHCQRGNGRRSPIRLKNEQEYMVGSPVIHYQAYVGADSPCGVGPSYRAKAKKVTPQTSLVTCRACRRTEEFRAAERRANR